MSTYKTKIIITYPYYDPELRPFLTDKFDLEDVLEFEDMAEMIYRNDFLSIFGTDEECVSFPKELFNQIRNDECMDQIIQLIKKKHSCKEDEDAFIYLFSYDYMFLTHKCICSFLENRKLSGDEIDFINLKKLIEKENNTMGA